jgi:formamidopyrimidine-DNA glycosylase
VPELPEVETMRRGVAAVVGARIVDLIRPRSALRPILFAPRWDRLKRRALGQSIVATGRAGKRLVFELSGGNRLVIEPRMTGLALLSDPPTDEHVRLRMMLAGAATRQFLFWDRRGLGTVRLVSPAEYLARYGPDHLGPDALSVTADQLRTRLGRSRRAVKVALLDQRAVAGIGNLYAAEILHVARIHPARPCDRLTAPQWQAIAAAARAVLSEAIRHEGSTLSDGTYRNALNQAGSYQNHHLVYGRAGSPCSTCGGESIARIVQSQRSTFFCPACQAAGRRRRRKLCTTGPDTV